MKTANKKSRKLTLEEQSTAVYQNEQMALVKKQTDFSKTKIRWKEQDRYFLPNGNNTAMLVNAKVYHKGPSTVI